MSKILVRVLISVKLEILEYAPAFCSLKCYPCARHGGTQI
jgi:hypothetical protein